MLHFTRAEIVEKRPPFRELFQIIREPFRQQDVTGVTAIGHALRDVDAGAGDIPLLAEVSHLFNRPAMDAHPNAQLRVFVQFARNFDGAAHRRLRMIPKHQGTAVASRQPHQFSFTLCGLKCVGGTRDLRSVSSCSICSSRSSLE